MSSKIRTDFRPIRSLAAPSAALLAALVAACGPQNPEPASPVGMTPEDPPADPAGGYEDPAGAPAYPEGEGGPQPAPGAPQPAPGPESPEAPPAGMPPQQPPAETMPPHGARDADAPAAPVSGNEVKAFSVCYVKLLQLQSALQQRAQQGEPPQALEQEFQQQAVQIIQNAGLSPQRYDEIAQLAAKDPELMKQVQSAIEAQVQG